MAEVTTTHSSPPIDRYLADFERTARVRAPQDPGWLAALRRSAAARFADLGFPTTRDEDWKYTNVAPLVRAPFRLFDSANGSIPPSAVTPFLFEESWPRLTFVNGLHSEEHSTIRGLPAGVRVESLAKALRTDSDLVERHLARHASIDLNGFTALSASFLLDGTFVHVPDGVVLDEPIHVIYVSSAHGERIVSHPRNLFVLGAGAAATIVETYVSVSPDAYWTNAVTEIVVGEGARLDHAKLLQESDRAAHIAMTRVVLARDAAYGSSSIAVGAELARNDLQVVLEAEGGDCTLDGLYLAGDGQHVDNHTLIDHAKPHGTSRELYKGILGGRARAVFNGKVLVRRDAQKTDAQQTNKNLLLSERAEVDTKPQLEIFADDVKCTHGAAIGQLDRDAVFYCQSRGMDDVTARHLLTHGFASEVISRIRLAPLRAKLDELVAARLAGLASAGPTTR